MTTNTSHSCYDGVTVSWLLANVLPLKYSNELVFWSVAPAGSGRLSDDSSDLSHHHQMLDVQGQVSQNER